MLGRGLLGPVQVSPPHPPLWVLTGLSGSLSARPLSGVGERPCLVSPEAGPGLGAAQSSPAGIMRLCNSDARLHPLDSSPRGSDLASQRRAGLVAVAPGELRRLDPSQASVHLSLLQPAATRPHSPAPARLQSSCFLGLVTPQPQSQLLPPKPCSCPPAQKPPQPCREHPRPTHPTPAGNTPLALPPLGPLCHSRHFISIYIEICVLCF